MAQTGLTILVTGASRGIGNATARVLLEDFEGLNVVAYSRTETSALDSLAQTYRDKDNALFVLGDLTKDADNKEAIDATIQGFGRLDAIVHCGGALEPLGRIGDLDIDEVRQHFEVNALSVFSLLRHALPWLRKAHKPKIVFITSGAVTTNYPAWSAYSAAKAAVESLSRTLTREEPDFVSVCLSPGPTDTGMQDLLREKGEKAGMATEDVQKFASLHQKGKLVSADLIGSVLASIAVNGDASLAGKVLKWNDDALKSYRLPPSQQ